MLTNLDYILVPERSFLSVTFTIDSVKASESDLPTVHPPNTMNSTIIRDVTVEAFEKTFYGNKIRREIKANEKLTHHLYSSWISTVRDKL